MKKISFFSLVLVFGFTSCQKCQECTTVTSQNNGGVSQSSSSTQNYCGKYYNDAPTPTSYSQTNAGVTEEVEITCKDQ